MVLCEEIAIGSIFKSKNETKEKVLKKSQGLVKIFRSSIPWCSFLQGPFICDVYKKLF